MRRPLRSDTARAVANLAIELGDPGRMAKARRLHRSNAVSDVDIMDGSAFALVVDASGLHCDVEIAVTGSVDAGNVPTPEDLDLSCSCDDAADVACVHQLAALLGIAEELEGNGRLLDVWIAPPIDTSETSAPPQGSFMGGAWKTPAIPQIPDLPIGETPQLVVDGLDAGPVFTDARESVRRGVSRFRSQR